MDQETKNLFDAILSTAQLLGLVIAALWAYFRFFREGTHKPRFEFDVQCTPYSTQQDNRVVSVVVSANNKGNVEHEFNRITLRLRGILDGQPLQLRPDERLDFPVPIAKTELVPKEFGYFFVRPGITQHFTYTTAVPATTRYLLVRAAFKYEGSKDLHTVERTFELEVA